MKKITVVTLQDNANIGNRLQNYALQTLIEKNNATVYNLDDGYSKLKSETYTAKIKNLLKKIMSILGNKKYIEFFNIKRRRSSVHLFTDNYIHNITQVTYDGIDTGFDLGIVGSDQVWHKWRNSEKELPYYYLEFLPSEKRASYAPSFGFSEFPKEDIEIHKKGLLEMKHLSCREQSGCDLIKQLTGRDAIHVLDPTLLLSPNDWRKLETNSNNYVNQQDNYIFLYFLGEITDEYQKEINKCSKNKKIINFNDFSNSDIASCGPIEFLYLIDHADYIFTDSFHATVFSVLFKKNFEVFKRNGKGFEDMYSRIEELLISTKNESKSYSKIENDVDIKPFGELKAISEEYLKNILS